MANIKFDTSDFMAKSKKLALRIAEYTDKAVNVVADEILRLSAFEVPHDTGLLQNSGHVESRHDATAIVGYNKVYAARLHEHPEYRFQKGRKGKYLEDPIKHNLNIFKGFMEKFVKEAIL